MKRTIATAFLAFASLLTAGNASAQDSTVQANIPFSFAVRNLVFPPGTYIVSSASSANPNMLLIRNRDHVKLATLLLANAGDPRYAGDGKLVFDRYGDDYFLTQILAPSAAIVANLPTSKLENRVRMREASLQPPEQVLLALK
jgi:hypothetical protein